MVKTVYKKLWGNTEYICIFTSKTNAIQALTRLIINEIIYLKIYFITQRSLRNGLDVGMNIVAA